MEVLKTTEVEMDIGEKMKQRALKNYGVQDFLLNVPLLAEKGENDVKYLWQWLDCKTICLRFLAKNFKSTLSIFKCPIRFM